MSIETVTNQKAILNVEDEEDTTVHFIGKLHDLGHLVKEARDRDDAIVAVKSLELKAVVLDSRFNGANGYEGRAGLEFIRDLKRGLFGELNRDVSFAVLTSFPHEVPVQEFLDVQGFCPPILSKLSADAFEVCQVLGLESATGTKAASDEFWMNDLLEVQEPADRDGKFFFFVPSWAGGDGIRLSEEFLPDDVRIELGWGEFPVYVWARVNVDAPTPAEVQPQNLRMSQRVETELNAFLLGAVTE